MNELFINGSTKELYIENEVPVYLLYYTVWINHEGRLVYGRDLYDYDSKLIDLLKKLDGFKIPVDNGDKIKSDMTYALK